ncbi:YbeD family protein [Isoalcanivorax beigongshangi]|uniref:YbeD family protein n=1 Tax=Isoalcanivorax beigongshangi TaxID=3238810 RepID=A0ABV4AEL6_9GAMM
MTTVNEHLWDFPHPMTLKVMGAKDSPVQDVVVAVLTEHLPSFDPTDTITLTPSSKGTYVSVNARVVMDSADQVRAIYAALNDSPHVKVVF